MKQFIRLFLCIVIVGVFAVKSAANNISISNVTTGTNATGLYMSFDLSWENSWRNTTNWDAAWVFFKFKDFDGAWHHLRLTNTNNSIASGFSISSTDLTGAMIYRSATGYGTVTLTGVQVGVMNLPGPSGFDIRAFAIEMVQIPQNVAFYLGDGLAASAMQNGLSGLPYLLNTTSPVYGTASGNLNDATFTTAPSAGFPIGYSAAIGNNYMMKHEISMGAYRDFLNCLTYTQQVTRTAVAPNSASGTAALFNGIRNSIKIKTSGVASTTPAVYGCFFNGVYDDGNDNEWIACNYITGMDVLAFLDWAALRPMTDYEFEKACRGPLYPVAGEYAWGDTAVARISYTVTNSSTANEIINYTPVSVFQGNVTGGSLISPTGPARVGIHATANSTRISAGAGYYGVLDMSGNVNELAVGSSGVAGRSFTGINGNGELNANGEADEDFWPGINGNTTGTVANTAYGGVTGVTGNAGWAHRGGAYNSAIAASSSLNTSYRINGAAGSTARGPGTGGRGVKNW